MKTRILLFFVLFAGFAVAQKPKKAFPVVLAGPMLGYAEHTEGLVWVQTSCAKSIRLEFRVKDSKDSWEELQQAPSQTEICQPLISKFVLRGLKMGSTYEYQILLDGVLQKFNYPLLFHTKVLWEWRTPPPDFTFMIGSCLYINDSLYDRPGKPYGNNTEILKSMTQTPSEFMLWLGDNTYLREADYSSSSGIEHRYLHTRLEPNLQAFLASRNHYAAWDDHDYGDNDANQHFELKAISRQCFTDYWGNKVYGENEMGVYSNFRFSDAEFILLDDRWFRDESELNEQKQAKTQLGAAQLSWLKDKLKHSRASFKFVIVGGQFINENTNKESYNLYQKEREEILQFLVDQQISGVILLSGDRHHTELLKNEKLKGQLGYPVYDLTCSSLTAGVSNVLSTPEVQNPQRVAGTLVAENNYCTLSISGPKRGERTLKITCFNAKGSPLWNQEIPEKDLKSLESK